MESPPARKDFSEILMQIPWMSHIDVIDSPKVRVRAPILSSNKSGWVISENASLEKKYFYQKRFEKKYKNERLVKLEVIWSQKPRE